MRRLSPLLLLAALALSAASAARAAAHCALTNFEVTTYAHSGTYLTGLLDGSTRSFLIICGVTGGTTDCAAPATERNLAVALTARALGRPLSLYFGSAASCAAVTNYTQVEGVTLAP